MENNHYHSGAHCVYITQYHIVWCPKFRYRVLGGKRSSMLKRILSDTCKKYGYGIKALEVMPDHIHIFVDVPHTTAPCDVARVLKSISAVRMFEQDAGLRRFYNRCGSLWSRGYFISSVGCISEDTVRKYIER